MNEIKSDVAGIVTEILIENEDVVEFGQALFRIA
jgi:acetyl-CoA carboxylase biotin carboxyl carrier protein